MRPEHPDSLSRMSSRCPDAGREESSDIWGAEWEQECRYRLRPSYGITTALPSSHSWDIHNPIHWFLMFVFFSAWQPLLTPKCWQWPLRTVCGEVQREYVLENWGAGSTAASNRVSIQHQNATSCEKTGQHLTDGNILLYSCWRGEICPNPLYRTYALGNKKLSCSIQFH